MGVPLELGGYTVQALSLQKANSKEAKLTEDGTRFVRADLLNGKLIIYGAEEEDGKNEEITERMTATTDHGQFFDSKFADDRDTYTDWAQAVIAAAVKYHAEWIIINCSADKRRSGILLAHLMLRLDEEDDPEQAVIRASDNTGDSSESARECYRYAVIEDYKSGGRKRDRKSAPGPERRRDRKKK